LADSRWNDNPPIGAEWNFGMKRIFDSYNHIGHLFNNVTCSTRNDKFIDLASDPARRCSRGAASVK
jgi:hypothetical protein